ncbi:hypothetical protein ACP70R_027381 [Stipagrostis hirtigluma subsp. patula]
MTRNHVGFARAVLKGKNWFIFGAVDITPSSGFDGDFGGRAGLAAPIEVNGIDAVAAAARERARPWYRRALCGLHLWRQAAAADEPPATARVGPGWRSNLKAAATSLARVACLAVHVHAGAPRGKTGRYGGRSLRAAELSRGAPPAMPAGEWAGARSYIRVRPLNEPVLVRRFVEEEESKRQRVQMEEAAKRYGRRWLPPGPSRLSGMSPADVAEDEVEENGWSP